MLPKLNCVAIENKANSIKHAICSVWFAVISFHSVNVIDGLNLNVISLLATMASVQYNNIILHPLLLICSTSFLEINRILDVCNFQSETHQDSHSNTAEGIFCAKFDMLICDDMYPLV